MQDLSGNMEVSYKTITDKNPENKNSSAHNISNTTSTQQNSNSYLLALQQMIKQKIVLKENRHVFN